MRARLALISAAVTAAIWFSGLKECHTVVTSHLRAFTQEARRYNVSRITDVLDDPPGGVVPSFRRARNQWHRDFQAMQTRFDRAFRADAAVTGDYQQVGQQVGQAGEADVGEVAHMNSGRMDATAAAAAAAAAATGRTGARGPSSGTSAVTSSTKSSGTSAGECARTLAVRYSMVNAVGFVLIGFYASLLLHLELGTEFGTTSERRRERGVREAIERQERERERKRERTRGKYVTIPPHPCFHEPQHPNSDLSSSTAVSSFMHG